MNYKRTDTNYSRRNTNPLKNPLTKSSTLQRTIASVAREKEIDLEYAKKHLTIRKEMSFIELILTRITPGFTSPFCQEDGKRYELTNFFVYEGNPTDDNLDIYHWIKYVEFQCPKCKNVHLKEFGDPYVGDSKANKIKNLDNL